VGIGEWLDVNGEAIYETTPWTVCQNETVFSLSRAPDTASGALKDSSAVADIYYTMRKGSDRLYAHITKWPSSNVLELTCPIPTSKTEVTMLGLSKSAGDRTSSSRRRLRIKSMGDGTMAGIQVELPPLTPDITPCQHAWVLVLSGIGNLY